jgi:hypothetical protein
MDLPYRRAAMERGGAGSCHCDAEQLREPVAVLIKLKKSGQL